MSNGTVHVYRDRKGEWRWRAVSRNGRKVANGGEGYVNKRACWRIAFRVSLALEFEIKTAPARRAAKPKSRALKRRAPPRLPPAKKTSQEQKPHA